MEFETVIGIEIHCELKTKSKMFSSAANTYGSRPNVNVSPVDMGFPGVMPVVNQQAVEYAIMAATALGLQIDDTIVFDRKNYFYPDLPKGYQITQQRRPIGRDGKLEIEVNGEKKIVGIERLHMEEDTCKQLHFTDYTLLNYNRCGVPLIEIVSNPDMRSGAEAAAYVETLRSILLYTGVSDVKMEEGSMRCDINISIRPMGSEKLGVKTEIKNLNSIAAIRAAVDFEAERQKQIILAGGKVEQETRRYDDETKTTILMRKKTDAVDYKYFTEPNIAPIKLSHDWIKAVQSQIPELPSARKNRYLNVLGLSENDANVILTSKDFSNYYDQITKLTKNAKLTANWLMSDVSAYMNKEAKDIFNLGFSMENLAQLINMVDEGTISSKQAKLVFEKLTTTNDAPMKIAKEMNLVQVSDESALLEYVTQVLDENADNIVAYKNGRTNLMGFFVGQVIKKSHGKANPGIVSKLMSEEIAKR